MGRGIEAAQEVDNEWICLDASTDILVDTMLDVLEYDKWFKNIFALKKSIRERRKVRVKRKPEGSPAESSQTIEVTVPEGMEPGQAIAVDYAGLRYEVPIPAGFGPGMVFQAVVSPPASQ